MQTGPQAEQLGVLAFGADLKLKVRRYIRPGLEALVAERDDGVHLARVMRQALGRLVDAEVHMAASHVRCDLATARLGDVPEALAVGSFLEQPDLDLVFLPGAGAGGSETILLAGGVECLPVLEFAGIHP